MDALSSQASAAGYRAMIVAANRSNRYLPMMITAAGTAKPASVIVLGAGVAGLQAIATAKRLGAIVTGYDVRPASKTEVESLGARFLTSSVADAAGAGGYARATSAEESERQQAELTETLTHFDIVITTAKVPGRKPPVLVTAAALAEMRRGSVCVDLAASELGGNVEGSVDGEDVVTTSGVTIVGGGNLASDLAASASQMYARNVGALIESIVGASGVAVDLSDDLVDAITVAHESQLRTPTVRQALGLAPTASTIKEVAHS
jgi:NAD(P) transhydrogenase subunit alpha